MDPMDEVKYAEDLMVGDVIDLGSHTVGEAEMVDFSTVWDPQDSHLDAAAAADGYFGGLIASGMHTTAVYQRLAVLGAYRHWSVIGARGLRDVRFLRPVRPGDVLTGLLVIDEVELDDRGRGLVTTTGQLADAQGRAVFSLLTELYLHRRP
ncbi:MaoC/PaaZ C-terminal domain-containing protein [Rhodococcus sp. MTM3W5.2]|uniref:MaoC/PaaZ C-terminal domain-containing protein n=1 Tax=Rhodococcus sp. MTM3W5.2 TaxID=1805827 RepID=UPI00097BDD93|nr:MaoC/PaaZ C-terminal domain-containing protein [Rhodococcus sp. MTM3W5.2]